MKKSIPVNPLFFYIIIICILAIGEAFAVKSTVTPFPANFQKRALMENIVAPVTKAIVLPADEDKRNPVIADADSIDFSVEVVQPHKFFLSFTKKREETFFIKIYDVIGNLIHHEVVSQKGKFRKQYDLSKYKTDLYVIEVSSGKRAKIKRLFLG
jgi:hypothetical protein